MNSNKMRKIPIPIPKDVAQLQWIIIRWVLAITKMLWNMSRSKRFIFFVHFSYFSAKSTLWFCTTTSFIFYFFFILYCAMLLFYFDSCLSNFSTTQVKHLQYCRSVFFISRISRENEYFVQLLCMSRVWKWKNTTVYHSTQSSSHDFMFIVCDQIQHIYLHIPCFHCCLCSHWLLCLCVCNPFIFLKPKLP